jgi:hypothetical protein
LQSSDVGNKNFYPFLLSRANDRRGVVTIANYARRLYLYVYGKATLESLEHIFIMPTTDYGKVEWGLFTKVPTLVRSILLI